MTEVDYAWAAGLYEGEGSVSLNKGSITMSLCMTDKEPVEQFCQIIGEGVVYGPIFPKNKLHKPYWRWNAWGWNRTEKVWLIISKWLSPRRIKQYNKCIISKPIPRIYSPNCGIDSKIPSQKGYLRHRKKGEPCCLDCLIAKRAYDKISDEQRRSGIRILEKGHKARGEETGKSKLTETNVITMRLLANDGVSIYALSKQYKVCYKTARQAIKGETWKFLNDTALPLVSLTKNQ